MTETENKAGITLEFDAAEAPVAPQTPSVTDSAVTEDMKKEAELTPEEQKQVDAFVDKIDITNTSAVMNYGVGTQKKLADFSQKTIDNVRTNDVGEVGTMLSDLVTQLKDFDIDENEKGIKALFKKQANKVTALKAKYSTVEKNVSTIVKELEKHQVTLMKDIDVLDRMYDLNLNYFKELTMYIIAGKKKLEQVRATDLKELQDKAAASGLPEDAQKAKDLTDKCNRFEKKLYDLELSRTIALQTGPQIRVVQTSDTEMAEKIQSTIVNTIPLWKNQMVIALGIEHSTQAAKAENEVNNMTNELLKKNADKLHVAAAAAAKESERGIVDIETLRHTNEQLISTIDDVINIQRDGAQKRHAAEAELTDLEGQLKQKLLEASRG
ncbi:toxic anion resistance protein [Blautia massiliensis (ex Durand et al. 2017)]|uniref:toxic anion resistance protein n=1 Tax=Blautia massiliensis (ex Durand et al. 2017) TaxID=1737424 RepID=UPI00242D2429|nr:toxic anion resistance protein [Blautia massiliensis (ex Durand et al. 2017)]MDD6381485.1 toxic anion resistance protein [Lachnospiraceae bacterium]MDD6549719.1 toxic anion resistance protein [Blautia massiliensis (ex Durand et al. 2017)]